MASMNQGRVKRVHGRQGSYIVFCKLMLVAQIIFYCILFIRSKSRGPDHIRYHTGYGLQVVGNTGSISGASHYPITLPIIVGEKHPYSHCPRLLKREMRNICSREAIYVHETKNSLMLSFDYLSSDGKEQIT